MIETLSLLRIAASSLLIIDALLNVPRVLGLSPGPGDDVLAIVNGRTAHVISSAFTSASCTYPELSVLGSGLVHDSPADTTWQSSSSSSSWCSSPRRSGSEPTPAGSLYAPCQTSETPPWVSPSSPSLPDSSARYVHTVHTVLTIPSIVVVHR